MATKVYNGGATAATQVDSGTPDTVEVSDIFGATLEDKGGNRYRISYTCAAGADEAARVKDVVDGLTAVAAAASAAGHAPWNAVTVTDDDAENTYTAANENAPFTLTLDEEDGGEADTQGHTRAAVTAYDGSSKFSSARNWIGEVAPVADDDVILAAGATAALYGEDFSGTVISSFAVERGNAQAIGSDANPLQLDVGGAGDSVVDLAGSGTTHLDVDNAAEINVTSCPSSGGFSSGAWGLNLRGDGGASATVNFSASGKACFGATPEAERLGASTAWDCDEFNVSAGELTIGSHVQKHGGGGFAVNVSGGSVYNRSAAGVVQHGIAHARAGPLDRAGYHVPAAKVEEKFRR